MNAHQLDRSVCVFVVDTDCSWSASDTKLGRADATAAAGYSRSAALRDDVRCTSDVGSAADIWHHLAARSGIVNKQWTGVTNAWCNGAASRCRRCHHHDQQWCVIDDAAVGRRAQAGEAEIRCTQV